MGTVNPGRVNVVTTPWSNNWLTHADDVAALTDLGFAALGRTLAPLATPLAYKQALRLDHVIDVRDHGAVLDGSTDDTAAIQAAVQAAVTSCQAGRPAAVYFPPGQVKLTDTIVIDATAGVHGLAIYGAGAPAIGEVLGAGGASVLYQTATILWHGVAAKPVIQFTGPNLASQNGVRGFRMSDLSIDGYAVAGTADYATWTAAIDYAQMATCGIAIGKYDAVVNEIMLGMVFERVHVYRCRIGAWSGRGIAAGPSHGQILFTACNFVSCTDHGYLQLGGNTAAVHMAGCRWFGCGFEPTADAINGGSGAGTEIYHAGGDLTLDSSILLGGTESYCEAPTTAAVRMTAGGLRVRGMWCETLGRMLYQSGPSRGVHLSNVWHYTSSMTETDTPTSIEHTCPLVLESCDFFGDVVSNAGGAGAITSIGVHFHATDLGTKRSTLGQGTFKGTLITTYRGLVDVGRQGNTAQIMLGGSDRNLSGNAALVGDGGIPRANPHLLVLGGGKDYVIGQGLSEAATDSGWQWQWDESSGAWEILVNCYRYGNAANPTLVRAIKAGTAYYVQLGVAGGVSVKQYVFSDTVTSQYLGYFVDAKVDEKLLGAAVAGMQTADGKTTVYTVPAGRHAMVTQVIIRNPTASLAGGTDYSFGDGVNADTWRTAVDLSTLTATTHGMVLRHDESAYTIFDPGDVVGIKPVTGATADADATVMVFGVEF